MFIVCLPRKPCGSLYLESFENGIVKWTTDYLKAYRFKNRREAEFSVLVLSSVVIKKVKEDEQ